MVPIAAVDLRPTNGWCGAIAAVLVRESNGS
jgi:hypothetical protein